MLSPCTNTCDTNWLLRRSSTEAGWHTNTQSVHTHAHSMAGACRGAEAQQTGRWQVYPAPADSPAAGQVGSQASHGTWCCVCCSYLAYMVSSFSGDTYSPWASLNRFFFLYSNKVTRTRVRYARRKPYSKASQEVDRHTADQMTASHGCTAP